MAKYLLRDMTMRQGTQGASRNPFVRFQAAFERVFSGFRSGYMRLLTFCVNFAGAFLIIFILFSVGSVALLVPWLGQDFFPSVDAGQFKIHVRARTGTRIEETAALCDHIDRTIRQHIPADEVGTIVDNIGLPYSGLNLSYSTSATVGSADADIQVQLSEKHRPTDAYVEELRAVLAHDYPGVTFYVLPVDIVTQILNFGLSAPIDVQIVGPNLYGNRAVAEKMLNEVRYVTGATDARIQQPFDLPNFTVNVDRTRAQAIGFAQRDVAQSLSGGVERKLPDDAEFLSRSAQRGELQRRGADTAIPAGHNFGVAEPAGNEGGQCGGKRGRKSSGQRSSGLGSASDGSSRRPTTRTDPGKSCGVQTRRGTGNGKPLRRAAGDRHLYKCSGYGPGHRDARSGEDQREIREAAAARIAHRDARAERDHAEVIYRVCYWGLVFSVLLVYLLIVVNFQSWLDPFLIISALPAALAGIAWFLFLTGTRLSVPALTGAIMCMGVATANSILVVSFAREQLDALVGDARQAALNAGFVRLRPVLMTALAMILGMMPMALGLGEGGEQNAPLGRAVIGGLLLATFADSVLCAGVLLGCAWMGGKEEPRQPPREAGRNIR